MIQYDVRPCKRTRYEYDEMTGDIIVMYGRVLDPGRTCALTHAVLTTVAHAHTHTHTHNGTGKKTRNRCSARNTSLTHCFKAYSIAK